MKYIIAIITILTLTSCASLPHGLQYKSDAPADLQTVFDDVNNEMIYDATAPKWCVNPKRKVFLGGEKIPGSCSNYCIQYMNELKKLGYKPEQLRLMYGHVYLKVTMPNGEEFNLDSAKSQIYRAKK